MHIVLTLAANSDDPLYGRNPIMPLSLPLLAASAPGHRYTFVDMLKGEVVNFHAQPIDLLGISVRSGSERGAIELAKIARQKGIPVVMGGPHASAAPERFTNVADAIVIGEGEFLWPRLIDDFQKGKLQKYYINSPISSLDESQAVCYQQLPVLDNLPFPNRSLFKTRYPFRSVIASRGCHVGCDFCLVSEMFGKKYRLRPIDEVLEEIKSFNGYYYLLDDTVFGRPATFDYYLELYAKIAELKKRPYWMGQGNLDAVTHPKGQKVIAQAARAGLTYAAIGIESIQQQNLNKTNSIKKMGFNADTPVVEQMKSQLRFIQRQGIFISGWFVFGLDFDTPDSFKATLDFCRQTHITPVFSLLNALPGSSFYKQMEADGRLRDRDAHITNLIPSALSDAEMMAGMQLLEKSAFTLPEIVGKSWQHFKDNRQVFDIQPSIYKAFFSLFSQFKLRKIVKLENSRMLNNFNQP